MFYAYGTWIYRFFLFLTIALLVYHLFFKLLGIFLMGVELVWFIARPIWGELAEWATRRDRVRINRNSIATLIGFAGLIALMLIPWRGSVPAPAIVRAEQQTRLFVPKAGVLASCWPSPASRWLPATCCSGSPRPIWSTRLSRRNGRRRCCAGRCSSRA